MPTSLAFATIDELRAVVGTRLDRSRWLTVDQDRIDRFAAATGDHQWIHIDPERAAAGPFSRTIAHGYLTLSLIPALADEVYTIETDGPKVNYGLNRVRFPHPVHCGASVRVAPEITRVDEQTYGHLVLAKFVLEIEGVERPGCVAEQVTLLMRTG